MDDKAREAFEAVREALPEFRQQDDYLLAHGASLMSEDSHEIVHVDTVRKIVAAALQWAASQQAPSDWTSEYAVHISRIQQPYTVGELREKIDSNEYCAELLLQHAMRLLGASQQAAETPSMPETWSVEVIANGESLVSIGECWLSGSREPSERDEQTILGAAKHLLSFIGHGLPQSKFDPDEEEPQQAAEVESEIWPIVNVTVDEAGNITEAKLYSPGLPAGNHDVYPVRVPYMDEHTQAWFACVEELRIARPGNHAVGENGIQWAVRTIRELAAPPATQGGADA